MAKKQFKIVLPKEELGIPIEKAQLHQAVSLNINMPVNSTLHHSKVPGIRMWLCPDGLLVTIKDKVAGIVPHANIALATPCASEENEA